MLNDSVAACVRLACDLKWVSITPQDTNMYQSGLMMDRPLLLSSVIEHAAMQFGDVEIVSRETHGPLFRTTY